ncbi:MAG: antitoxin VapB family protein [Nanoarchaeota archaeon]|nr:antitoxin VapB family protein [Nanoarchaeota archaeon]
MSKLINVSDDVYEKLSELKGKDSYTAVIKRLIEKKTNKERILEFAGKGGINVDEIKEIKKGWKKWSEKYV